MEQLIQELIDKPSEANAVMAFCALVTSILSIYITVRTLQIQKRHNFQSVRPIAWVSVADFEDRISVTLQNNGVGPMIIKKVDVKTEKETKGSLIDWMPTGYTWDMFVGVFEDRSLSSGQVLTMLQLSGDPRDPKFVAFRDQCRRRLASLVIEVTYEDIYERPMKISRRTLEWFSREK